jgi:RNA polymerase sigma factor (sigma-70 family)
MQAKADAQLLREYAFEGSEAAFGEIVARYTDLVYSTVLRQAGSPDLAEEVAQSVFTDLARKAPALAAKLGDSGTIVGWLYRGSRYALTKHLRAEQRRHTRENLAMQNLDPSPAASPDWERLRPVLDKALADLSEEDRQAMLLRFFQNQGFQAVGAALGVSEDTAQKRVARALEKLRAHLARQGITTAAAMLSTILSTNAVQPAPAGLAARLAGASLAGAAKTGTTLTLMTLTSFKTGIAATAIAAALAVGLAMERRSLNKLQEENAALRQQISLSGNAAREMPRPVASKADNDELERLRREHAELLRLRGEVGLLRDAKEKQQLELAAFRSENAKIEAMERARAISISTVNALKILGGECYSYAQQNDSVYPTNLGQIEGVPTGAARFPLGTNSIEFIDYGQPVSTNATSYTILVREREPRQLPDGSWSRMYLFADGSVQEAVPSDGDFDTWEKNWVQQQAERMQQQAAARQSRPQVAQ